MSLCVLKKREYDAPRTGDIWKETKWGSECSTTWTCFNSYGGHINPGLALHFVLFWLFHCVCTCVYVHYVCAWPKRDKLLDMISVAHRPMFSERERRHHLPAWLSERCHVLDWDVNHPLCINSLHMLTLSDTLRRCSSFLASLAAKHTTVQ